MSDPTDKEEQTFCSCHNVDYGTMIQCDNENCKIKWFHLRCVCLIEAPPPEIKWFCIDCSAGQEEDSMKSPTPNENHVYEAQRNQPELYAPPHRLRPQSHNKYVGREIINTKRTRSDWYLNANMKQSFKRSDVQQLAYVKTLINNVIVAAKRQANDIEKHTSELRTHLHDMEFYPFLSDVLIRKSKVLEAEGVLQILDGPNKDLFPWDIRADAEALWQRWMSGDIDTELLRGIESSRLVKDDGSTRRTSKLEKEFANKKSANALGSNGLINGQWWPSRLACLRDGAHGEQEAGISGQAGVGAFSVVVAVGGYADKDDGEVIHYCGTQSDTPKPTRYTAMMLESCNKGQVVRVLRAVNKNSLYAPKAGIRYDGIYKVTNKELLDGKTAMYRFLLERQPGQDPIRYKGVETRPTERELQEFNRIQQLLA